jgi:hypothetical protein
MLVACAFFWILPSEFLKWGASVTLGMLVFRLANPLRVPDDLRPAPRR